MNQKIIAGAALLMLIVAGVWYFSGNKAEAPSPMEAGDEADRASEAATRSGAIESAELTGLGSFASLMRMGRSLTCDFTYESDETNAASAGTVYVDGDRMRGDFETTQAGTLYTSHMIHTGADIYTWSESSQGTFAMKMSADVAVDGEDPVVTTESPDQASFDLDHEVDYTCRPWGVDEARFTPPSDITFMDMDAMMQGGMPDFSDFNL